MSDTQRSEFYSWNSNTATSYCRLSYRIFLKEYDAGPFVPLLIPKRKKACSEGKIISAAENNALPTYTAPAAAPKIQRAPHKASCFNFSTLPLLLCAFSSGLFAQDDAPSPPKIGNGMSVAASVLRNWRSTLKRRELQFNEQAAAPTLIALMRQFFCYQFREHSSAARLMAMALTSANSGSSASGLTPVSSVTMRTVSGLSPPL